MTMKSKLVNIHPTMPIFTIAPPITGVVQSQKMNIGDIEKCLLGRAVVEEILPDKSTIQLSLINYKEDFVGAYENSKAKVNAEAKAVQEKKAVEEAAKKEAERLAREKAEQERLAAEREAKQKAEEEKKAAEAAKAAEESAKKENQPNQNKK